MSKTKDLIKWLQDGVWTKYNDEYLEEIIQHLREYDELKKLLIDLRKPLKGDRK